MSAGPTPVAIDGELTVYVAHELRQRLMQALEANAVLTLDLTDVAEFDGAGVQLLLAAQREATERGGRLLISAASPTVVDTLNLIGLGALLAPSDAAECAA